MLRCGGAHAGLTVLFLPFSRFFQFRPSSRRSRRPDCCIGFPSRQPRRRRPFFAITATYLALADQIDPLERLLLGHYVPEMALSHFGQCRLQHRATAFSAEDPHIHQCGPLRESMLRTAPSIVDVDAKEVAAAVEAAQSSAHGPAWDSDRPSSPHGADARGSDGGGATRAGARGVSRLDRVRARIGL